jgi:hypothetical protein
MGYHEFMVRSTGYGYPTGQATLFPLSWGKFKDGEPDPILPPDPKKSLFLREGSAGPADLLHCTMKGHITYDTNMEDASNHIVLDEYWRQRGNERYWIKIQIIQNQWWYASAYDFGNGKCRVDMTCEYPLEISAGSMTWHEYAWRYYSRFPVYGNSQWGFQSGILLSDFLSVGNLKEWSELKGFWNGGTRYRRSLEVIPNPQYPSAYFQYTGGGEAPISEFTFKHNELDTFTGWRDLKMLPNLYRNGFACAFTEAAKRLPFVATNSLANLVELAAAIMSIANGFRNLGLTAKRASAWTQKTGVRVRAWDFKNPFGIKLNKSPKQWWLAYRYSYTTTKADVEEYTALLKRLSQLPRQQHVKVGGTFQRDDMYFRATAEFVVEDVLPENVREMLGTFNAELSARNVWDLIPFSFVVDWFLRIGDMLERYDLFNTVQRITPSKLWFSYRSSYPNVEGIPQDIYMRIEGVPGLKLGNPVWSHQSTSLRTKLFRVIDGLALFG